MNQLLGSSDVTVTLQWPQEAGAVYHVNAMPHIESITNHNTSTVVINLTISYNIHYNVSIVSSLCGVTITRVLKYYGKSWWNNQIIYNIPVAYMQQPVIYQRNYYMTLLLWSVDLRIALTERDSSSHTHALLDLY